MWYYAKDGNQHGPYTEASLKALIAEREIGADTLVWRQGMGEWTALRQTEFAPVVEAVSKPEEEFATCAYTGVSLPRSQMIELDGYLVGLEHKDAAVQYIQQGGQLPNVLMERRFAGNLQLGHLFRTSWEMLFALLLPILAIHFAVVTPCNLISSYFDTHVFGDEEFARAVRFDNLLGLFVGIIATGGILHLFAQYARGRKVGLAEAFGAGFSNWGRLWVVGFLSGLIIVFGTILLIVPGIIAMVRLSTAEQIAVDQQIPGSTAISYSWHLTKGVFWKLAGYGVLMGSIAVLPLLLLVEAFNFLPEMHWSAYGLANTVGELPTNFLTAFYFVFYKELSARRELAA